ncbi:MAG: LytTR family DNA-binding domain-containing protein [Butyrivibrio sp.]|uniref:LytR/AlgR family response regulator transcription factor n=1 Tax=Butyrivibrio sp. TaxID=28121 RepID=UPI0025F95237|nr:LytTR family DNA-binding domain-containing protein [Butyrivibrio sp.]MCR5772730.1 LytTR family DNA-binding domain-containing protein [Butyrivibrio sp.]
MTRILIADDERPARSELRFLLEKILIELGQYGTEIIEASSGAKVLELIEEKTFDACFLDIEMGDIKGTELAMAMREKKLDTAVIFVTAYASYAVNAFDVEAMDYVLKPFDESRIKKSVQRLLDREMIPAKKPGPFALPAGDHMEVVTCDNISYIEAIHKGAMVHCHHEIYHSGEPLIEWEKKLSPAGDQFVRVHKSFIVNLKDCEALVPDYNNGYACKLKECGDTVIPISRNMIHDVRARFNM